MQCIQGKHTDCREKSIICEAHMPSYSTKSLPYGKHITLSFVDMDKFSSVVSKYVSPDFLKEMARLSTKISVQAYTVSFLGALQTYWVE